MWAVSKVIASGYVDCKGLQLEAENGLTRSTEHKRRDVGLQAGSDHSPGSFGRRRCHVGGGGEFVLEVLLEAGLYSMAEDEETDRAVRTLKSLANLKSKSVTTVMKSSATVAI